MTVFPDKIKYAAIGLIIIKRDQIAFLAVRDVDRGDMAWDGGRITETTIQGFVLNYPGKLRIGFHYLLSGRNRYALWLLISVRGVRQRIVLGVSRKYKPE